MKIILLSGGSGQRLWPLSNHIRSKQFLKLIPNEEGFKESMIQRVWRQLKNSNLSECSYVSTNVSQLDIIQNQLQEEVPLIVEPTQHDTFPAISLAAVYLHSVLDVNTDEVVCVLPVDLYVESKFFEMLPQAEQHLKQSGASLALIGVRPSYPSEQYGYIVPFPSESHANPYGRVQHFVEKPKKQHAQELIEQNALWNCGAFICQLSYLLDYLTELGIPIQYDSFIKKYTMLPKISFDYEVVEKTEHIIATTYDGYWNDLGNWETLTSIIDCCTIGKGIVDDHSINTHLINELDIPVVVSGMYNSVVIVNSDGILVANKYHATNLKEILPEFRQRPMYEERRWGSYKVLDYCHLSNGKQVLTKRLKLLSGKNLSYQLHHKRQEVWTIISGEGELVLEGKFRTVQPGDVIEIPIGAKHGARATVDLEIIEVQIGTELIEEDIVRLYMTWDEIEKNLRNS